MLDFSWMSASQTAALIIGIVLSVLAVGTTFLAFKYANKLNSFLKAVAMSLIAPFLAMVAWLFLILSFLDGFRKDELLNIVVSILIALFVCTVIVLVAKALYNRNRDNFAAEEQKDREEQEKVSVIGSTPTYLLAQEENEVAEEKPEAEEAAETETTEEVAEEEPVIEEATEPVVEEKVEEKPAQKQAKGPVVEDYVPEEETAEVDETEDDDDEADDDDDEDFDEDDDDDEEFNKFLEALRARRNQNPDNQDK